MPNLISSSEALQALQAGPCRVAREGWDWGKWVESYEDESSDTSFPYMSIELFEGDEVSDKLWEREFQDHSANDWYVLEPRA